MSRLSFISDSLSFTPEYFRLLFGPLSDRVAALW